MILKSSKEAECPEVLMWENMLDIAGLDDGFPVIGEIPKCSEIWCVNDVWYDPHTTRNSIDT